MIDTETGLVTKLGCGEIPIRLVLLAPECVIILLFIVLSTPDNLQCKRCFAVYVLKNTYQAMNLSISTENSTTLLFCLLKKSFIKKPPGISS